ncbi:MAG: Asp-tRNA(Asn)/Glu-tRNA(Gln) amidotransferase subunit GatC [Gammaproteobacteria bacterium]|nr:Asp-tRNA(Asn)/Glu-tRNA(Gln) amidotransferase subunit GatC [Gammaproteobacteria bacterium]
MSLDKTTVAVRLRILARLSVDADDTAAYQEELGQILELVDQLERGRYPSDVERPGPSAGPGRSPAHQTRSANRTGAKPFQAHAPAVDERLLSRTESY